jgi:hypothetical protein
MELPPAKTCVVCGEDCSGRPRIKDPRGRYHCKDCYERVRASLKAPTALEQPTGDLPRRPCANCGTATPPGAVICTNCGCDPATGRPSAAVRRERKREADPEPEPAEPEGDPARFITAIGLGGLVVVTAAALILGNLVTGLFVLFVALAVVNGYWIGATRIAALLGGLFVAAILTVPMGKALEGAIGAVLNLTGLTNRLVSIAIVGLLNVLVVTVILQIVIGRLRKRKPDWERYDRLIGSGLGLVEGALLGLVLIWSVLSLEPIATTSLAVTQEPDRPPSRAVTQEADRPASTNPVSERVVTVTEAVRQSTVGRVADAINPLDEMRLITLFQNSLVVINDPAAREAFVGDPAIEGIRQRPSVQRAMDMLMADPEIRLILESEDGITGDDLRTLLDSPTLLSVLDDTDLVEELSPIAGEIEQAIEEALQRRGAVPGLADIFPDVEQAVADFAEALGDPDPRRRVRAANSLGSMGAQAQAAVPVLVSALDDREASVRVAAANALARIGPGAEAAIPRLTEALAETDAAVRAAASEALEQIRPEDEQP